MTTKELKKWADKLYKEHGDVECFFRDYDCYAYRDLDKIYPHISVWGENRENEVLVLDLPKIEKEKSEETWISVDENLPNDNETVLLLEKTPWNQFIYNVGFKETHEFVINGESKKIFKWSLINDKMGGEIAYWMLIPKRKEK